MSASDAKQTAKTEKKAVSFDQTIPLNSNPIKKRHSIIGKNLAKKICSDQKLHLAED